MSLPILPRSPGGSPDPSRTSGWVSRPLLDLRVGLLTVLDLWVGPQTFPEVWVGFPDYRLDLKTLTGPQGGSPNPPGPLGGSADPSHTFGLVS